MEDPEYAVTQLAQTTMRSELGKLSLDKVFRVRRSGPGLVLEDTHLALSVLSGGQDESIRGTSQLRPLMNGLKPWNLYLSFSRSGSP